MCFYVDFQRSFIVKRFFFEKKLFVSHVECFLDISFYFSKFWILSE